MGPRTYGLGPIILGLTLLLVGVPAMIYVGRHRGLADGVQGALLGALVLPFVLLVIVAGLCVATVNPFPPSARAPTEPGPPPEEVATELGDGRLARASGVYGDSGPAYAFDGDRETIWNSGSFGPQWIEIDLPAGRAIMGIRLVVAQSPGGETDHQITGFTDTGSEHPIVDFLGVTVDGQVLAYKPNVPLSGFRSVRVTTYSSPSWVAWREIEIDTVGE
jgi:hypothetical protein